MAILAYVSCIHEQLPTMSCASAVSRPKTQPPCTVDSLHCPGPYVQCRAKQKPCPVACLCFKAGTSEACCILEEESSRPHAACCIPAARPKEVATMFMTQTTPQGQHMWSVHATPKADDAAQHITHSPCGNYTRQHHAPPKPCAQAHRQLARCIPLLKIWLARGPAARNG
jgi:hypothetical protein